MIHVSYLVTGSGKPGDISLDIEPPRGPGEMAEIKAMIQRLRALDQPPVVMSWQRYDNEPSRYGMIYQQQPIPRQPISTITCDEVTE